jgi:phosphoglycolate phosphatase-like HAD superfamily hydrolase
MNACRIESLVFWADGVVVTPPGEAAWALIAPGHTPDAKARLGLHRLEEGLADGALSPDEFCARAAELGMASGAGLMEGLSAQIAPISGMPEVLEVLASRRVALSLVSACPRQWLIPALRRCGLGPLFPEERVWATAEYGGFPQILDALIEGARIAPGRSLWVDHHSLRTRAALRRGIDAAVFVHARQFHRDLGLWGLVPFPRT